MAIKIALSDDVIRHYAHTSEVRELADLNFPVRLRFHKARTTASFFLVKYQHGKDRWQKVGDWPALSYQRLAKDFPEYMSRFNLHGHARAMTFTTMAELLHYYLARTQVDTGLSPDRRTNIKSHIKSVLLPAFGDSKVNAITAALVDDLLMRPQLAAGKKLQTVEQYFNTLNAAFNFCDKQHRIKENPLRFVSFKQISGKRKKVPKPVALSANDIPAILKKVIEPTEPAHMLCLFMLLHLTRIGETRRLRWRFINASEKTLVIPAHLTKTKLNDFVIYLSDFALDKLVAWHKHQVKNGYRGEFIFTRLSKQAANELIKTVSQGRWTSHDLRIAGRTMLVDGLKLDYWIGERMLNHALVGLDETYIKSTLEPSRRQAYALWHDHLVTLSTQTDPRSYDFLAALEATA